jgi:hypothetical protein
MCEVESREWIMDSGEWNVEIGERRVESGGGIEAQRV